MSNPIAQSAYAVLYRIEEYKQLPNPHPRSRTLTDRNSLSSACKFGLSCPVEGFGEDLPNFPSIRAGDRHLAAGPTSPEKSIKERRALA